MSLPQVIDTPPVWDTLEDDGERFEFAQYVVNTAPEDRTEISPSDAEDALAWMSEQGDVG
jgi:hypothetical protein